MLSYYLPVFLSNDQYADLKAYIRQNPGNADFVLLCNEEAKKFLDLWRLDLRLGVGNDLSFAGWHGLMCYKFYYDWWVCCGRAAKEMFLDESTGLLMQQARYRSTIVGAFPYGAHVISMEAEPVSLQDHRACDLFATINRGVIREPYNGQPVFWLPKLVTADGVYLKDRTNELILKARKKYLDRKLSPFTPRQNQVLTALADGFEDNNEIAKLFDISPYTVETHRKHMTPKGQEEISKYLIEPKLTAWYLRSIKML